jgi:hypothetical protein
MNIKQSQNTLNEAESVISQLISEVARLRNIVGRYNQHYGSELPAKEFIINDEYDILMSVIDEKLLINFKDNAAIGMQRQNENLLIKAKNLL